MLQFALAGFLISLFGFGLVLHLVRSYPKPEYLSFFAFLAMILIGKLGAAITPEESQLIFSAAFLAGLLVVAICLCILRLRASSARRVKP